MWCMTSRFLLLQQEHILFSWKGDKLKHRIWSIRRIVITWIIKFNADLTSLNNYTFKKIFQVVVKRYWKLAYEQETIEIRRGTSPRQETLLGRAPSRWIYFPIFCNTRWAFGVAPRSPSTFRSNSSRKLVISMSHPWSRSPDSSVCVAVCEIGRPREDSRCTTDCRNRCNTWPRDTRKVSV